MDMLLAVPAILERMTTIAWQVIFDKSDPYILPVSSGRTAVYTATRKGAFAMPDRNHDGKTNWHDDYLHMEMSKAKPEHASSPTPASSSGNLWADLFLKVLWIGCAGVAIIIFVVFLKLFLSLMELFM